MARTKFHDGRCKQKLMDTPTARARSPELMIAGPTDEGGDGIDKLKIRIGAA